MRYKEPPRTAGNAACLGKSSGKARTPERRVFRSTALRLLPAFRKPTDKFLKVLGLQNPKVTQEGPVNSSDFPLVTHSYLVQNLISSKHVTSVER